MNTISVTLFLSCLEQGIVLGELSTESGVTVINAEVSGGLPPPNYFLWSDHLDNGTRSAYRAGEGRSRDRKSTRLNSSHVKRSRMPSSA